MKATRRELSAELIREFVIAGHGNLEKVKAMLAERPDLLPVANEWQPGDTETGIQAAAHVGSAPVAEFLLAQGAPLEICTAAMLGRKAVVEQLLAQYPGLIDAHGAHGIPLMPHAALSGHVGLAEMLAHRGAREGWSMALSNAVSKGHVAMARWLLERGSPDLAWKNYEGKTPLEIARERSQPEIVALLQAHGAGSPLPGAR